ncbi:MAG: hypothetical protein INQ03_06250 [Candidatus Heimdallarchaeota archaeon]|nr:hypothetical protein [Candidatus Heimdallarchaeota archaeon]
MKIDLIAGFDKDKFDNLSITDGSIRFDANDYETIVETHVTTQLEKNIVQFFSNRLHNDAGLCLLFTGTHASGKTENLKSIKLSLSKIDSTVIPVFIASAHIRKIDFIERSINDIKEWLVITNRKIELGEFDEIMKESENLSIPFDIIKSMLDHLSSDEIRKELELQGYKTDWNGTMGNIADFISVHKWKILYLIDDRVVTKDLDWFVRDVGLVKNNFNFVIFLNQDKWKNYQNKDNFQFEFYDQIRRRHANIKSKVHFNLPGEDKYIDIKNNFYIPNLNKYLEIKVSRFFKNILKIVNIEDEFLFPEDTLYLIDNIPSNTILLGNKVEILKTSISNTLDWFEEESYSVEINELDFKIKFGREVYNSLSKDNRYKAARTNLENNKGLPRNLHPIVKALIVEAIDLNQIDDVNIDILTKSKIIENGKVGSAYLLESKSSTPISIEQITPKNSPEQCYTDVAELLSNKKELIPATFKNAMLEVINLGIKNNQNISDYTPFTINESNIQIKNERILAIEESGATNPIITIKSGLLSDYNFKIRFHFIDNIRDLDLNSRIKEIYQQYYTFNFGPDIEIIVCIKNINIIDILKDEPIKIHSILPSTKILHSDIIKIIPLEDYNISILDLLFIQKFLSYGENSTKISFINNSRNGYRLLEKIDKIYNDLNAIIYSHAIKIFTTLNLPNAENLKAFLDFYKKNGIKIMNVKDAGSRKNMNNEIIEILISKNLVNKIEIEKNQSKISYIFPCASPLGIENPLQFIEKSKHKSNKMDNKSRKIVEYQLKSFLPIPQSYMLSLIDSNVAECFRVNSKKYLKEDLEIELQNRKSELEYLVNFGVVLINQKNTFISNLRKDNLKVVDAKMPDFGNIKEEEYNVLKEKLNEFELVASKLADNIKSIPDLIIKNFSDEIKGRDNVLMDLNKSDLGIITKNFNEANDYIRNLENKIQIQTNAIQSTIQGLENSFNKICSIKKSLEENK